MGAMEWKELLVVGLWLVDLAKAISEAEGMTPPEFEAAVVAARKAREGTIASQVEAELKAMEGKPRS